MAAVLSHAIPFGNLKSSTTESGETIALDWKPLDLWAIPADSGLLIPMHSAPNEYAEFLAQGWSQAHPTQEEVLRRVYAPTRLRPSAAVHIAFCSVQVAVISSAKSPTAPEPERSVRLSLGPRPLCRNACERAPRPSRESGQVRGANGALCRREVVRASAFPDFTVFLLVIFNNQHWFC